MSIKFLQLPVCKLSEFVGSAVTSFEVSGFLYNDGITPVDPSDIGDVCYATLEPKTAREELISFTIDSVTPAGVATITAVRGLLQKSPYTVGGAAFDHQNGSDFVISNNPGLFNHFTAKDNTETITAQWSFPTPTVAGAPITKTYFVGQAVVKTGAQTISGVKTFSSLPLMPNTTPTVDTQVVSKKHLDDVAVKLTGDQTVAGEKTFSTSPKIPDAVAADEPYTKGQHDADATASSAVASPTVRGTTKLDAVADNVLDPEVLTATADRVNFINAMTGMLFPSVRSSAPAGFLICDGAAVSRSTYSDLFSVIGTTFGAGDGSTTFNVPDIRGSVLLGAGQKIKDFNFVDGDVDTVADTITIESSGLLRTGQRVSLITDGEVPTNAGSNKQFSINSSGVITGDIINYVHGNGQRVSLTSNASVHLATNKLYYVTNYVAGVSFTLSETEGGATAGTNDPGGNSSMYSIGLNQGTTYYIIRVNNFTVKLATTRANADDDIAVDIIAANGGGTHSLSLILTSRTLGEEGGEESHFLQTEEIPSHKHDVDTTQDGQGGSGSFINRSYDEFVSTDTTSMQEAGGDQPHNNMPPYVVGNWMIKT